MKRKLIITLLALSVSLVGLSSCGKADDIEPVISEAVETPDQQEVEEETTIEEEDIIEEEPEQDVVEADTVEEDKETDIESVEEIAENTEEPTEQIDITTLDKMMYAQSEVNTRMGDSTDYEKVGSLTANQEVHVIGQSNITGWYQIDIDGAVVFVSDKYLADTKVEIQEPTQQASSTTQQSQHSIDDDAPDVAPTNEEPEEAKAFWNSIGDGKLTDDSTARIIPEGYTADGIPISEIDYSGWGNIHAY